MVAVAVVPTVGESVATVQQPGISLRGSLSVSLSSCLPLLPAVVAVVVAKAVVAVVASVGVGSVAVGKVTVAMGPVAVGPVEHPGIGLRICLSLSVGLSSGLPLLPRLLNSGLSSGNRGGRNNSNETTMSAGHHSAGVVLASGGGGVDDGGDGVGGVGEGRAVGPM